jgi:hypothetical protein
MGAKEVVLGGKRTHIVPVVNIVTNEEGVRYEVKVTVIVELGDELEGCRAYEIEKGEIKYKWLDSTGELDIYRAVRSEVEKTVSVIERQIAAIEKVKEALEKDGIKVFVYTSGYHKSLKDYKQLLA